MRLLSLDQSLSATGQALFIINNKDIESITISSLFTNNKTTFEDRLWHIYNSLSITVETEVIDTIVYEGIFKSLNVNTLIKLAKVQGIVELIISKYKLNSIIVTPKEWQAYLKLDKIKDKNKSLDYINNQDFIMCNLNNKQLLNTHTADALCMGLYFINN
jgi:Holliday junction resolvasome RuvABC endonuclease subunit